jgi:hypothetical protein
LSNRAARNRHNRPQLIDISWEVSHGDTFHNARRDRYVWHLGKLTDDDLTVISGKREQLEGLIQQRYGLAKDKVRKDVDDWLKSQP